MHMVIKLKLLIVDPVFTLYPYSFLSLLLHALLLLTVLLCQTRIPCCVSWQSQLVFCGYNLSAGDTEPFPQ